MIEVDIHAHIARVSDILEQIERLNQMVAFHRDESKEFSMMRQYEEMRSGFLDELKSILADFKIEVEIRSAVA
jgi:hypothetical protein